MKRSSKWLAAMLSAAMVVSCIPGAAYAGQQDSFNGSVVLSGTETEEKVATLENLPDSDELFAGYVNEQFGIDQDDEIAYHTEAASGLVAEDAAYAVELSAQNQMLYDYLVPALKEIADGETDDTIIHVPISALGIEKTSYTARDLGLTSLVSGWFGTLSSAAQSAMNAKLNISCTQVMKAISLEHPYELYWFDKTVGYHYQNSIGLNLSRVNGEYRVSFRQDYIELKYNVSDDYRGSNPQSAFRTDKTLTKAASTAASNAFGVIEEHKYELDYDKLCSYMEYICENVEYNHAAVDPEVDVPYGDPWQLIFVFDEDPDTDVVCEGYSKAYKYLYDNSIWHEDTTACYIAEGVMRSSSGSGGRHMWNVVTLGDANYLADVTNSDGGTAGFDGGLFLNGYAEGSMSNGYGFALGNRMITYTYDSKMFDVYDARELALSHEDYDPATQKDHTWVADQATTDPTCTEAGVGSRDCSICGLHEDEGEIPATGHDWEFVNFTWQADGEGFNAKANYKCKKDETHVNSVDAAVRLKSSTDDEKTFTATVLAKDSLDKQLHTEDHTISTACEHNLSKTDAVAATCETAGNSEYWTCSICGKHFSDAAGTTVIAANSWVIPMLGHSWGFTGFTWSEDEFGVKAHANYVCGRNSEHTASLMATVTQTSTDADCEHAGSVTYTATVHKQSSYDQTAHTDTKTVTGTLGDHKLTRTAAKAADCETAGNSAYWTCSVCGKHFSDAEGTNEIEAGSWVIGATGHDWDEGTVSRAATCTSSGTIRYTCKNNSLHTRTETIPALGHDWQVSRYIRRNTCTTAGYAWVVCSHNSSHVSLQSIPATGHDWGEWVVVREATAERPGLEERVCKNDPSHVERREIAVVPHDHVMENMTHVDAVSATCTTKGNEEHYVCNICGKLFFYEDDSFTEVSKNDVEIAALGHKWDEGVKTKDATCTENGSITYTCENDPSHTRTESIPATGHKWDEGVVTKEPTRTEPGVMTYTCQNDPTHTRTETIPPTGQNSGGAWGGWGWLIWWIWPRG